MEENTPKYYAGIGSRVTPENVLQVMKKLAIVLAKDGWTLRSGAADGADTAFEKGCDSVMGNKEIYLPWKCFNNSDSTLYNLTSSAEEIAFQFHPNLYAQSEAVIKLMTRNTYQVLGPKLSTPSKFILCYAPLNSSGVPTGGTSQAIRIAERHKIPVFNLYQKESLDAFKQFYQGFNP